MVGACRELVPDAGGAGCTPRIPHLALIRKTAELCHMRRVQKYRKNAHFVMDVSKACTRLDRNQKAKLLRACEIMERATKRKGRRNGIIGIPGMIVLRCLLLQFHGATGLCCPSYTTIQRVTGLCRQSVATALSRLQRVGVLHVRQRLVRIAGVCRQASNLYSFSSVPRLVYLPGRNHIGFAIKGRSFGHVPQQPGFAACAIRL